MKQSQVHKTEELSTWNSRRERGVALWKFQNQKPPKVTTLVNMFNTWTLRTHIWRFLEEIA